MLLLAIACTDVDAATLTVGKDGPLRTIAEAARIAQDGDVIEVAGGVYGGDVAVFTQKRLTIRGIGDMPVLKANGRSAEGKAIFVLRNGTFVVENLAFEGARVADRNGAGIRFERGSLTVRRCRFTDNENGILTGNDPASELVVEDSSFSHAPRDRGPFKHLLYVGQIARFTLTGSRFHQGFEGHLVKSRARESRIAYNLMYDGADGMAAYELELPNGGLAFVIGNVIGQSATTTNQAVVSYGAEGAHWDRNELYLVNNTLLSDLSGVAWFLRFWSERLPDARLLAVNNLTVGIGVFTLGARGRYAANYPVLASALGDAATLDFRLGSRSLLLAAGATPPVVDGRSLAPTAEFALPIGTAPLAARETWTPGAFQSTDPSR